MNAVDGLLKTLIWNWPFANGSGRLVDAFASKRNIGDAERSCMTSDGFPMAVLGNDLIGRHIFYSGKFDRTIAETLLLFAESGDSILDIGANIGYMSCVMLHNVRGSTVTCVEPQPDVATLLRKNLSHFGADRGTVLEAALSDFDGTIAMDLSPGNSGGSAVTRDSSGSNLLVPCLDAGRYLAELQELDLLKIDVERHEQTLLRAAQQELKRLQPRAIVFESHGVEAAPSEAVGRILEHCGYDIYGIQKNLLNTRYVRVLRAEDCKYNDYLAVSRTREIPPKARLALDAR